MSSIVEINKLKNIQKSLEKGESLLVKRLVKYETEFKVVEFYKQLSSDRKQFTERHRNCIKDLFFNLDTKKVERNHEELDLIQADIQDIGHNAQIILEALQRSENELYQEVNSFEQKLVNFEGKIDILGIRRKAEKSNLTDDITQEVKNFLIYLVENGGHENGWPSEDHNVFLKFRNKYKGSELAEKLHLVLPDLSVAEILEHEEWYRKYLELNEKKKEAIKKWRDKKLQKNTKQNSESGSNLEHFIPKIKSVNNFDVQKKITAWKTSQKENQEREKFIIEQQSLKRKDIEKIKKKKEEEIKLMVEKWKQFKTEKHITEKSYNEAKVCQEKKIRAETANKLIKQFQSQDKALIAKVIALRAPDSVKPRLRTCTAKRDPSRLFKPTKQWLARTSSSDIPRITNNYVTLVPKLGIPDWRKDLLA